MNNSIEWHCKHFTELSPFELYDILQLRSDVFVVEQNCVFLEPDGIADKVSYHLFAYQDKALICCCRLIDANVSYAGFASIGRVVNAISVRGSGIGRVMMEKAIAGCRELFGKTPLRIGAQFYLRRWYESLGFVSCDDNYLEDGIEHVHMELFYEE